jgi:hypothetical protein
MGAIGGDGGICLRRLVVQPAFVVETHDYRLCGVVVGSVWSWRVSGGVVAMLTSAASR